jgi:phospholipid transport system substrate-binding protein
MGPGTGTALAADAAAAKGFVQAIGKKVVATLMNKSLSVDEKVADLNDILKTAVDLPLVARLVMGRYWRQATDSQRQQYMKLFKELVTHTMATRLNSYGGQTFDVVGSTALDDSDSVVATKIVQPSGGPAVNVDWRVRQTSAGLKIIDIVAEGVSMVVTQRSEAADIISSRGIDGLLTEMQRRLTQPT